MTSDESSRPYRKEKRARHEAETRRRITEAAVELHRSVGPARTSVTDIARRAGVSRTTVYNHFPTGVDLFAACSGHWAREHPLPDPEAWAEIADPDRRLRAALGELYRWYERNRQMLGKVLRDARTIPALAEVMDGLWTPWMETVVAKLAEGREERKDTSQPVESAVALAVDFDSWRTLTDSGLESAEAAELAAAMVIGGS